MKFHAQEFSSTEFFSHSMQVGLSVSEGWEMIVFQIAVIMARAAFSPIDLNLPVRCVRACEWERPCFFLLVLMNHTQLI
jgi:hypothetical protein